jgi:ribulose-5-phosphate 4-epimerase/fuculose-1-phosphate aldolase
MWTSSPFLEACRDGNLSKVIKMTEDKEFHEDVLNQPEYPSQKTPLHLACLNDYPEIVTFLLSKGVNPNLVDFVNVSQHFYL